MAYRVLADVVLAVHFGVVVFVIGGLVAVVVGNRRGWRFVNGWWFRLAHLAAIGVVVAQAWLGVTCPLTTLESRLRMQAGSDGYETSFVEHWLGALLFYEAPSWVFTTAYTLFGVGVAATWWLFPPARRASPRR